MRSAFIALFFILSVFGVAEDKTIKDTEAQESLKKEKSEVWAGAEVSLEIKIEVPLK